MPTQTDLQVEANRRAAELARASESGPEERYRIYDEINRRAAERNALDEDERQRAVRADAERHRKDIEFSTSPAGQILDRLTSIQKATQSTADSVRQIRNALAFLIVLYTLLFLVSIFIKSV